MVRDVDTAEPDAARPWLRRLSLSALFAQLTVVMDVADGARTRIANITTRNEE